MLSNSIATFVVTLAGVALGSFIANLLWRYYNRPHLKVLSNLEVKEYRNFTIKFFKDGEWREAKPSTTLRAFYLKVINKGRSTARNCRAYLVLEGSGYAMYIQEAPYYEITLDTQIPWYYHGRHNDIITLNPGDEALVGIVGLAGNVVVFPSAEGWIPVSLHKVIKRDKEGVHMMESHSIHVDLFIYLLSESKIRKAELKFVCEDNKPVIIDLHEHFESILKKFKEFLERRAYV